MSGLFITGTDTGVGKTRVSCAVLEHLKQAGHCVQGMKPVAAGCDKTADGLRNDDALQLMMHSSQVLDYEVVNPYAFEAPAAPHVLAEQAGIVMDSDVILSRFRQLSAQCDQVVVEGAGGWLVPFNQEQSMADLAKLMRLPVVMVVGIRLGCINHALLTYQSIIDSGLSCLGWVANEIEVEMPFADDNVAAISERVRSPLLARWPYAKQVDMSHLAETLNLPCYTNSGSEYEP